MAFASFARSLVVGASLAGLAVASAPFAAAQQNNAVSGGLAGYVTDSTGAAVPGAKITLVGPQQTLQRTSDASGHYEVRGLTPGQYTMTVVAPGFSTFVSKANEVTIDHTASLDAKLAIGQEATTVEVDAGATQIDTENTSVNTELTDTFLSQLPVGRNVSSAFYIAPGVVSGGGTGTSNPSIGGSSGLENNYTADGVTITDQAFGGLGVYTPQYGSLGTGITQSFVKEVDIKTEAFEPKYGQGDGGIVEIVTKSGSNTYHGDVTAYVSPESTSARPRQLGDFGYVNPSDTTFRNNPLNSPQYEGSATFGGYVIKDKLFFFGAFDPTLNRNIYVAEPSKPLASKGSQTLSTTSINWAGKLTFTPFASTILEASSYGDPSRRNVGPESYTGNSFNVVSDSYNYGTRNSTLRLNTILFKGLTGFGAYAYSTEHFNDSPLVNSFSISDRTGSTFTPYGFGTYYKTKDANYTIQGEVQEAGSFLGKHVVTIGYLYNHVDFDNSTLRTGADFGIPGTNFNGDSLTSLYPKTVSGAAIGKPTNASFYLLPVTDPTTKAPLTGCTYCALNASGQEVFLQQVRGTYKGSTVAALSRYKAAFGNEVYSPNRYLTINAGLRWEEQNYGGALLTYNWSDNWSPRLGLTIDPFGDRKSKVFFAFSRYQNPLPLDAAIRQLGNEQDDTSFYYAPLKDASGNAILDANGSVQPDTSKVLNGTQKDSTGRLFGGPNFSSSTGEGILKGTKMSYLNEYVLGIDRQVTPRMVFKARYIDRQFGRIVEDIGSQSPEGSFVDGQYAGGIANVTSASDFFVNEQEVTYTPAQFAAANNGCDPSQIQSKDATKPCYGYTAPVAGCTAANDTAVGNGGFFQHPDGSPYDGGCITNASKALGSAGSLGADGKSDGFANPRRRYQGLELELDRTFRNHWQARINYRYSNLFGNYEGFYRNDNGQSDPGISSLFDFTTGDIGVLGDQFKRGYLNTDRRHVGNLLVSYTLDKTTPYFGRLNGLTIGTWLHGLSGVPLSAYESHPVYTNAGEVPVGGRGTLGRTPANVYADASLSDTFRFHDKYALHAAFDGFNITNSQAITNRNQNLDTSPGAANVDYNRPNGFVNPFHARFTLGLSF